MVVQSAQVEFQGIVEGITKVLWIQKLLNELDFPHTRSCDLFCDNKAVISISENPEVRSDTTREG